MVAFKVGDTVEVVKESPDTYTGQFSGQVGIIILIHEKGTYLPNLVLFPSGRRELFGDYELILL